MLIFQRIKLLIGFLLFTRYCPQQTHSISMNISFLHTSLSIHPCMTTSTICPPSFLSQISCLVSIQIRFPFILQSLSIIHFFIQYRESFRSSMFQNIRYNSMISNHLLDLYSSSPPLFKAFSSYSIISLQVHFVLYGERN